MDSPGIFQKTYQKDYKRLYYSEENASLKVPITLKAGYGLIEAGTALARNTSAAATRLGYFFPYDPTATITGAEVAPGRAYLVQDSGAAASDLYVTINDSYKFAVGDDVIIVDNDTAAENLGAITAIDRTTYTHMAKITVTVATGGTSFTTADFAYIVVEGYDVCVGILEKSVDTGTGANANGANATLILGNCVLYTGSLINLDSAAKTDLAATAFGIYTYMK